MNYSTYGLALLSCSLLDIIAYRLVPDLLKFAQRIFILGTPNFESVVSDV
jgi:hypothetical protein